jgi:hypothetical protein
MAASAIDRNIEMIRHLMTNYAIRARVFCEAVARLGSHDQIDPELLGLLGEIFSLHDDCIKAGNELKFYVERVRSPGEEGALERRSA